jgi:REP element-mobilizing transposase RayT
MRKTQFANNEFYHVYNRGTDKRKVFLDNSDYQRFLLSMQLMNFEQDGLMQQWRDYKTTNPSSDLESFPRLSLGAPSKLSFKKLVDICCYSLLPNHYHIILKQIADKGIERFMQRLGTGYSMFFNKKNDRTGSLFQGPFKATHIKTNPHLFYLSAYVNLNSEVHGIARAEMYRWSSFPDFIGKRNKGLCENGKKMILDNFRGGADYKKFAKENAKHFQEKKMEEKMMLEE